jgi:endonuclease/exonuclease/phosphatase family metal-dependent hydrolase
VLTDAAPDGPTYPADVPARRIDYVTVSRDVAVRHATVPKTLASDHRPVLADLTLRR